VGMMSLSLLGDCSVPDFIFPLYLILISFRNAGLCLVGPSLRVDLRSLLRLPLGTAMGRLVFESWIIDLLITLDNFPNS